MALTAPWRGAQNCRPSRPRGEEPETADPHGPVERRPALQTLTARWRGALALQTPTAPWRGAQNCRPSWPRGEEPKTADPHGPMERRPALQTLTAPWRGAQNCRPSRPHGEEPWPCRPSRPRGEERRPCRPPLSSPDCGSEQRGLWLSLVPVQYIHACGLP